MDYCIWKPIDVRTRCHQAFTYDRSLSLLYWQMAVCHPFRIRIMRKVSLLASVSVSAISISVLCERGDKKVQTSAKLLAQKRLMRQSTFGRATVNITRDTVTKTIIQFYSKALDTFFFLTPDIIFSRHFYSI